MDTITRPPPPAGRRQLLSGRAKWYFAHLPLNNKSGRAPKSIVHLLHEFFNTTR